MTRIALAILALVALAAPAAAQNENKWGAIAFGAPDRLAGTAVDYASADEARQAAAEACGGQCPRTIVFYGSCAAVAQNDSGAVGAARNRYRGRAQSRAMIDCARGGAGCSIAAWACTSH